jgi:hypothetical protein
MNISAQMQRKAMQVGHSLNMVAELPNYVDDVAFPVGLRVAAVDAFFVHLRLLAEFLVKKRDQHHPAIHRDDFAPGFHLASVDSNLYQRLDTAFELASRHVAHFSVDRVPDEKASGVQAVDAASLRRLAGDAFGAVAAYIKHARTTGSPYAEEFARLLTEAQSRHG